MNYDVLIVEDEPEVVRMLSRYLATRDASERGCHYQVVGIARDCESANKMVDMLEFDLLLMDVYLPDGTSLDVLAKVRAEGKSCEAMLLTAAREVNILERGMQLGVCDFLVKPVLMDRLNQALQRFETRQQQLTEAAELTQGVADAVFSQNRHPLSPSREIPVIKERLPKGVDPLTLAKILALFEENRERQSTAADVGQELGISRSTARRYLEYLASVHKLAAEQKYGTVGRPERSYRLHE